MSDFIVTMRDARSLRYCASGTLRFLKRYNLDYRRFFKHGLPAYQLESTGDAMALRVVEVARGRQQ
ncbi:MAG: hypothetical protein GY703_09530 [Gammaproteobacteria bacterium]|nr:hypothetical protein [Gammaproteobacteria bacterium]